MLSMTTNEPGSDRHFRFWYLAFTVATVIPVWGFDTPAMVDAPQHLSQLANVKSLLYGNSFISSEMYLNLFTPYLTTSLILTLITLLSSPALALKIATSFYLLVLPWCCLRLLRLYKKPDLLCLLSFPLLFNLPFNWGFIPFMVTVSLGCLWLVFILERDIQHFSLTHIALSYCIAFGHAIAWGLIITYILTWLIFNKKPGRSNAISVILLCTPAILLLVWFYHIALNETSATRVAAVLYQSPLEHTAVLVVGHLMGNDLMFGGIKLFLYCYMLIRVLDTAKSFSHAHQLVVITLGLFYLLPSLFFSTSFFSDRLAVLLPVFLPLLFRSIKKRSAFMLITSVCLLLALTSRLHQQWILEREGRDFESVTHSIPANTHVFYISDQKDFGFYKFGLFPVPYYLHHAHWLRQEKELLIDFSFAYYFNQLVRHINEPEISSLISYQYQTMDWKKIHYHDYILVRDCSLEDPETIATATGYRLTERKNCWTLFRRAAGYEMANPFQSKQHPSLP